MSNDNDNNKDEDNLYKTLALNDTIHDFGDTRADIDIKDIVKQILSIPRWKPFNLMGTPGLFKQGNSFEKGTEKYVLQKYNLPGIPDDMIEPVEYFIKSDLGDATSGAPNDIPIIEFINDNNIRNYAIVLTPEEIAKLTPIQKENILETSSNIHSSIDFIATLIVKDEYKLFKATKKEAAAMGIPNDYNKIGQFIMQFYFYGPNGPTKGGQTLGHASDAGNGHIKCLFSDGFQTDEVIGTIRNTTTYGDSAGTSGDDVSNSCGLKGKESNKENKEENDINPFNNDIGNQAEISRFPSLFPQSKDKTNKNVYIFKNNIFTRPIFRLAYVENENSPWIPSKAPRNFSFCVYYIGDDANPSTIDSRIINGQIEPIGRSNFYPDKENKTFAPNGPSVAYIKLLIQAIYGAIDLGVNSIQTITSATPKRINSVLNLNNIVTGVLKKPIPKDFNAYLPTDAATDDTLRRKYACILLLLDIKRCGDYEQVDSIKLIQDQNSIGTDEFGLRDIMFSTIDRLCSLYSRYNKTNVVWARTSPTPLYQFYRQPYIPLDPGALIEVERKRDFTQMKNKIITIKKFLDNVKKLKPYMIRLKNLYNTPSSIFQRLRNPDPLKQDQSQTGIKFIEIMYDSIKNMVEFQNNSLFNKFFIDKSLTEENGTQPYIDPLVNITSDTDYKTGDNYDTIKNLYNNWCEKFYNIIDNNMYCWFDINKSTKKIQDENGGERIIPSYSVKLVNKTCHQFIDDLTKNENTDPLDQYKAYYNNILQARNAIENIYEQSGRQFWPARIPRADTTIINTESVIKLYTMFEGIMSSFDMVFNINNRYAIDKVKQVLNEITNKFYDGTLLMTRGELAGKLSKSADDFVSTFTEPTGAEDELFTLVNGTNMPGPGEINDTINNDYDKTIQNVNEVKKSKKEKREEKAAEKEKKEKDKRIKRRERLTQDNENKIKAAKAKLPPRRSSRISQNKGNKRGGNKLMYQTGGAAQEDSVLGIVLMDNLIETPSIINQIYSDLLPLQLLQDYLDGFDMEYTGFDASDNLLTLSREEYMDDFITTLVKILENDIFKNQNNIIGDTAAAAAAVVYTTFKELINTKYVNNKDEEEKEKFIVSDGFTNAFNKVYDVNRKNLDNITWTYFLEKIKTNDIYKPSIETEIESITNQFITDILNYKAVDLTVRPITEYITDPSANDTTQQFVDYIFISLLWNGGYDASCSFNTPEYVNIPQIVDTSGQYVESTPLPAVENNDDLDSMGKWEDLLGDQSTEVSNTNNNGGIDTDNNNYNCDNGSIQCTIAGGSKTQVTHQQQKDFINKYITYLKDNYCNITTTQGKQTQKNILSYIKKIKDKYGDVGIFYILSLIVNIISNENLYIPSPEKDKTNIINKLTGTGIGASGELKNVTFQTFFKGISNVYNLVASKITNTNTNTNTTAGGSNKSNTHKKRDKRRQNRKTMKSKNRVF
mgnify:CR=1 FL=1